MLSIDIVDAEAMIRLLATVADPTVEMPLAKRKRGLLEGLGQMIEADVWLWITSRISYEVAGDAAALSIVDGGWVNEQQRADFFRFISHPDLAAPIMLAFFDSMSHQRPLTLTSEQMIDDASWKSNPFGIEYRTAGFDHAMISAYPVGGGIVSSLGFHRRTGKPPFSDRDRTVVHVMFQQVDWLHRAGSNVPASENVIELSPRERHVTMLLMGGDSRKQVAAKLRLSQHTVADYLKEIYRKLGVNSRAELLAKFLPIRRSEPNGRS
jgi:DNA-binding CsgD family transcriptional regulator